MNYAASIAQQCFSSPRHPHARAAVLADLFNDLEMFVQLEQRIAALPNERLRGAAFEVFAEAWLATQRLSQARNIWPADSVPSEIQSILRLPLKDMGVDGVFDTRLDEYICYQAKFRTGRPSLAWGEIATFFGLADFAAERLLFTNCDDVSEIAEQRRDVVFVRGSDLDRLTPEDFRAISEWIAGAAAAIPKKTPKPHQEKAIKHILRAFETKPRVTALMACGTGKTLVALWAAERLQARSVLVLVPSLALVRQVLHEWLHETNWSEIEYLCVCSDESVDRGNDELVVRPSDVDFKVTTQSSVVREFLVRESSAVRVVFSTYQSSPVVAAASEGLPPFDFAVFDEAHKTAGREGARFAFALSDGRLGINRRLFMTATPRHYDVEVRDKAGDAKLVYSMDDPEVYGSVAHRISFSEAANLGVISDYKVVISVVTSEMVTNELLRRGTVLVSGEEIKAAQVANQIALRRAVEEYGVRKIFTFHSRLSAAESFTSDRAEGIRQHVPGFAFFFVKGLMPAAYRDKLLREFSTLPRAIMSNARCLTEGVDLPAVDMVAFFSPKRSLVDIVQATGRAMRRAPGKAFGYVLVPLYVEHTQGETVDQAVHRRKFDEVMRVLQSLKEHDDLLAQIVSDMRIERGRTGGYDDARFRERVELLGPTLSLETLRRSITTACIDALGETWFERYGELAAYKEESGHCDIPKRSTGKLKKLANWIVQQRVSRNDGTLTREKIELLDRLGFKWSPYGHRWRENYLALIQFKQRFGDCRVPQEWKENRKLATWVCTQRLRRKAGALSDDRIRALDKLGFDWHVDVGTWEQRFAELCAFKQRFKNTRVNVKWSENPQLGAWVVSQRYRRRRGKLRTDYEQRLNEIGFEWDVLGPDLVRWEKMFNRLLEFRDQKFRFVSRDNTPLAEWMQRQRRLHRRGKLSSDLEARLTAIGFPWVANPSKTWDEMLGELALHRKATGSCEFSTGLTITCGLKRWCTIQRKLHAAGQLTADQTEKLNVLGFVWNHRKVAQHSAGEKPLHESSTWDTMLRELVEYFKIHGNFNVPQVWRPKPALGRWVAGQRSAWRQGQLSKDRQRSLEAIGFDWRVHDATWEDTFERAREFFTTFRRGKSAAKIPRELRNWMITQRLQKRNGKLDAERESRLSEAGFDWNPHQSRWQQFYDSLEDFYHIHRHCRVPADWPENPSLAHWVAGQRASKRAGKLSADRVRALERLGFAWAIEHSSKRGLYSGSSLADWEETFSKVREFKQVNGHFAFPQKTLLADWAIKQRILRRNKELDPARERALNEIGFDWDPINNRWERMFNELLEFKRRYGHVNVPQKSRQYPKLAAWVAKQRFDKKKNRRILATRAHRLDELGFTWAFSPPASWEQRFSELLAYRQEQGNCNVPQHWAPNKQLGKWVNTQRTAYKRGKISPEKQKLLEEIGFAWRLAPTNKRLVPPSASIAA